MVGDDMGKSSSQVSNRPLPAKVCMPLSPWYVIVIGV